MKRCHIIISFFLLLFSSCSSNSYTDDINCRELVSSKGEKIYVLSTNWGITGDYQLSSITKNKNKYTNNRDILGSVSGLNPFEYRFENDTLTLYFRNEVSYRVLDSFKTITIQYKTMDANYYDKRDTSFHSVPVLKPQTDLSMPVPPSKNNNR